MIANHIKLTLFQPEAIHDVVKYLDKVDEIKLPPSITTNATLEDFVPFVFESEFQDDANERETGKTASYKSSNANTCNVLDVK